MHKKILICGSREATSEMLNTARNLVKKGTLPSSDTYTIIVGDANGVDKAVIRACIEFKVPFICFGITVKPRVDLRGYGQYIQVLPFGPFKYYYKMGFIQRDKVMANYADQCWAIWNGESTGTMATYNHAVKMGRPSAIRNFKESPVSCPNCESTETFNRADGVLCLACGYKWDRPKFGPSVTSLQIENKKLREEAGQMLAILRRIYNYMPAGEGLTLAWYRDYMREVGALVAGYMEDRYDHPEKYLLKEDTNADQS